MTPRPRKVSDEEVLEAAHRAMQRLGPNDITLAAIGAEAGLTPGALVQRFGSKRQILLALVEGAAGQVPGMFAGLRAAHDSPLEVVLAYGRCMAAMGDSPTTLAHHLSYLQLDLSDPDFNRHARAQARATRTELEALLSEAVAAGELMPDVSPEALARQVEVTVSGSLVSWGFYQDGTAADWVQEDLETLLEAHRGKKY